MATNEVDLSSVRAALPSESSEVKSKPSKAEQPKPLEIKVLSWNIHGPGKAEPRNLLVPRVIQKINPDVLLLQETATNKLVQSIKDEGRRVYHEVCAGKKTESRVVFDSDIYENIPYDRGLFHDGDHKESISLKKAFELSIERAIPEQRELRAGTVEGMKTLYKERVSVVGLKRRDQELTPERVTVFMSFHNVNTSQTREVRDTAASKFCEIVAAMRDLTGTAVVAGADLNCSNINNRVALIPEYEVTERRKWKGKIDYFILASPPAKKVQSPVTALDFVEADEANPLHAVVRDLLRQHPNHEMVDYKKSLDHDPLVCDLKVTVPI